MEEKVLKKLRIAREQQLLVLNAPEPFMHLIGKFEYDKLPNPNLPDHYDAIILFGTTQEELEELCLSVKGLGKYDCLFWACYPKGTSKNFKSDIKRDTVWQAFSSLLDIRAVTQVALDNDWSALRARPYDAVGK